MPNSNIGCYPLLAFPLLHTYSSAKDPPYFVYILIFDYFKCFFTGVDDHSGIQSIINIPANDTTAVPVDNGCQIKKSMLHWNVCNVNRPCLIGTVYDCVTKQIRTDFCLLHALRQIHLWINRCNVHFLHCFLQENHLGVIS